MSDQQDDTPQDQPEAVSLDDDQIEDRSRSASRLGRRTFLLGAVGGTTALAGCVSTGITDADTGRFADPVGGGRGTRPVRRVSGITDRDVGPGADPVGDGRGGRRRTGITDSDVGPGSDPVGGGRGGRRRRSCTDSDLGRFADPVGRGRRC